MIFLRIDKVTDLSTAQRIVMIAVCSYANKEGLCTPSHKDLCQFTGASLSSVKRALTALENKHYLSIVHRRYDDGGTSSNLYRINLDKTADKSVGKVVNIDDWQQDQKLFINVAGYEQTEDKIITA